MKYLSPILFLVALCIIYSVSASGPILLSSVQELHFYAGQLTAARRAPAVNQMTCVGGTAQRESNYVTYARCTNQHYGMNVQDPIWKCDIGTYDNVKLGTAHVNCEGYNSMNDAYVLDGSCGLEYTLDYVNNLSPLVYTNNGVDDVAVGFIFVVVLVTILIFCGCFCTNEVFVTQRPSPIITRTYVPVTPVTPVTPIYPAGPTITNNYIPVAPAIPSYTPYRPSSSIHTTLHVGSNGITPVTSVCNDIAPGLSVCSNIIPPPPASVVSLNRRTSYNLRPKPMSTSSDTSSGTSSWSSKSTFADTKRR